MGPAAAGPAAARRRLLLSGLSVDQHSWVSAFILLLLVLDLFGSLPIFIPVMCAVDRVRRRVVALREVAIAFVVLLLFGEASAA